MFSGCDSQDGLFPGFVADKSGTISREPRDEKIQSTMDQVVRLNLKGKVFEVSLSVLCHPKFGKSFFTQMFRGLLNNEEAMQAGDVDETGAFVLHERDPEAFSLLLQYISSGELPSTVHEKALLARGSTDH